VKKLNTYALLSVLFFAVAFLGVYLSVYYNAFKSYKRGELEERGVRILRLGLYGHLVIFAILGVTAFLT
jgi:hypothetical protein